MLSVNSETKNIYGKTSDNILRENEQFEFALREIFQIYSKYETLPRWHYISRILIAFISFYKNNHIVLPKVSFAILLILKYPLIVSTSYMQFLHLTSSIPETLNLLN